LDQKQDEPQPPPRLSRDRSLQYRGNYRDQWSRQATESSHRYAKPQAQVQAQNDHPHHKQQQRRHRRARRMKQRKRKRQRERPSVNKAPDIDEQALDAFLSGAKGSDDIQASDEPEINEKSLDAFLEPEINEKSLDAFLANAVTEQILGMDSAPNGNRELNQPPSKSNRNNFPRNSSKRAHSQRSQASLALSHPPPPPLRPPPPVQPPPPLPQPQHLRGRFAAQRQTNFNPNYARVQRHTNGQGMHTPQRNWPQLHGHRRRHNAHQRNYSTTQQNTRGGYNYNAR